MQEMHEIFFVVLPLQFERLTLYCTSLEISRGISVVIQLSCYVFFVAILYFFNLHVKV